MPEEMHIVTEIKSLLKGTLHEESPFAFVGYLIIAAFIAFLAFLYITTDMPFTTFIIGPIVVIAYWFGSSFAHTPAVYKVVNKILGKAE